jgi:hypothetical protein
MTVYFYILAAGCRDHILTRLLKPALTGNCCTYVLAFGLKRPPSKGGEDTATECSMAFTARLGRLSTKPSANVLRVDESQSEVISWMRRENSSVRGELATAREQVAILERFLGQKGAHDAKLWDVMRELEGTRSAAVVARRRVDALEAEVAKAQCEAEAAAAAAADAAARVDREAAATADARRAAAVASAKGTALEAAVDRMARQLAQATGMAPSGSTFTRLFDAAKGAVQGGLSSRPTTSPPVLPANVSAAASAAASCTHSPSTRSAPVLVRMHDVGDRIVLELAVAKTAPVNAATPVARAASSHALHDASKDLSPPSLHFDDASTPAQGSSPPPAPRTVSPRLVKALPETEPPVQPPPIHSSIVNLRHALDASLHGAAQQHSLRQTQALRESTRACAAGYPDAPVDAGAVQHLLRLFMRIAKAATAYEATPPPPRTAPSPHTPRPGTAPLTGIAEPEESLTPHHMSGASTSGASGPLPPKGIQSDSITPRHLSSTSTPATSGALPPRDFLKPKSKQLLADNSEAVSLPPQRHRSQVRHTRGFQQTEHTRNPLVAIKGAKLATEACNNTLACG